MWDCGYKLLAQFISTNPISTRGLPPVVSPPFRLCRARGKSPVASPHRTLARGVIAVYVCEDYFMSSSEYRDEIESDTKTVSIHFRATVGERATITAKAAQAGLGVSEYIRRQSMNGVVIIRESAVNVELVRQLSAIGNNLNQLTRKEHIHDEADTEKMRVILEAIDNLIMGVVHDR